MEKPERSSAELYLGAVSRLATLFGYQPTDLGRFDPVTPDELPADYRNLLAHTGHMTVTLEALHGSLVDVRVLQEHHADDAYAREILLARQSDGRVVQYGLMRIWLPGLPDGVRQEIASKSSPLGRVLIRHGVLREVELLSLWRIDPLHTLRERFEDTDAAGPLYGRSAQILVQHRPTVQLLEIVPRP